MREPDLAVLFLARGADGGLAAVEAFLDSYRRHPAGCPHRLVLLAKGWDNAHALPRLRSLAEAPVLELPDEGFDLGAYFRAANILPHRLFCLLNTHSRIIADDWLRILLDALAQPDVGAAGATGSWESKAAAAWEDWRGRGLFDRLRHLRRPLRVAKRYPPFPNAALRTTGVVIPRALLQDFGAEAGMPQSREAASLLESGRQGLSAFLRRRSLMPVVAGADGRVFMPDAWDESGTFRCPGQPNLLIADNRTGDYEAASPATRRELERLAWGRCFTPA